MSYLMTSICGFINTLRLHCFPCISVPVFTTDVSSGLLLLFNFVIMRALYHMKIVLDSYSLEKMEHKPKKCKILASDSSAYLFGITISTTLCDYTVISPSSRTPQEPYHWYL